MIAYVTSIGEKTTEICCEQLKRYGFNVVLLDEKECWINKYKRFINMADEDCLRVDADVIVNKQIRNLPLLYLMAQFKTYDLYKNGISITSPVLYEKEALEIIRKNIDKLDQRRPETSAWRLKEINKHTKTWDLVVGIHGFFQHDGAVNRAKRNKEDRGQIDDYDFELVERLRGLK